MKLDKEQKFTQPPAQFSEATLVKALEENGIGRPSTYAAILSTLTTRDYAEKLEGRFNPLALGKMVNSMLQQGFADILNEGYTAELEEELDRIEEGKMPWKQAVEEFDGRFSKDLATATDTMPNVKRDGVPVDEKCPKCGADLVMRFGRYGAFLGCSTYRNEPPCDYTRDLNSPVGADGGAATSAEPSNHRTVREVRQADGDASQPLRHLPRLHRLPGVQEHPQDRTAAGTAERHRRPVSRVQAGDDPGEEVAPRQDLLLLQPLPRLQVRAVEPAGRATLPQVRLRTADLEDHQAPRHRARLPERRVRLHGTVRGCRISDTGEAAAPTDA